MRDMDTARGRGIPTGERGKRVSVADSQVYGLRELLGSGGIPSDANNASLSTLGADSIRRRNWLSLLCMRAVRSPNSTY